MNQKIDIDDYSEKYSSSPSNLLNQLERETYLKSIKPYMISGRVQGRFLSFISQLMRPKSILELGTFTGYATLCLAEGLSENGMITTIEVNEEMEPLATKYFEKAGLGDRIQMLIGDAIEVMSDLNDQYDLVFIDAKKSDYPKYYEMIIDKVNPGGVIIADNVIWYGKVAEEIRSNDMKTKALQEFNAMVQHDPRVENFILPVRDGLNIVRKK